MTQGEVLTILKNNQKTWFTYKELKLRLGTGNISGNAARLYKAGEIDRMEFSLNGYLVYLIRHKRK